MALSVDGHQCNLLFLDWFDCQGVGVMSRLTKFIRIANNACRSVRRSCIITHSEKLHTSDF